MSLVDTSQDGLNPLKDSCPLLLLRLSDSPSFSMPRLLFLHDNAWMSLLFALSSKSSWVLSMSELSNVAVLVWNVVHDVKSNIFRNSFRAGWWNSMTFLVWLCDNKFDNSRGSPHGKKILHQQQRVLELKIVHNTLQCFVAPCIHLYPRGDEFGGCSPPQQMQPTTDINCKINEGDK